MFSFILIIIGLAALVIILAPAIWAGYRLYSRWPSLSIARRIGMAAAGLGGAVAAAIGITVLGSLVIVTGSGWDETDTTDYASTLKTYRFPDHIDHFPEKPDTSRIRSFGAHGTTFPDLHSMIRLHMEMTKVEADTAYARANREAQYVVTWADSAGTQRQVDVRASAPATDLPTRADVFPLVGSATKYVAYVWDAQEYQRKTERAESQVGYIYGTAFHKHRREAIYWAFAWTY